MQSNGRLLTPIEIGYAKKQLKGIRFGFKYVKLIFLLVLLMGVVSLFAIEYPLIGLFFFFIGLFGFIFFHHFSDSIQFNFLPESIWLKGKLNYKYVGAGRGGGLIPFLDEKRLYCPAVITSMLNDLVDSNKKFKVELAVCEYKRNNEKQLFHIPLRIENKICIQNALNKYGLNFSLIPTLFFVINILLGTALFGPFVSPVIHLLDSLSEPWNGIVLMILSLPLIFLAYRLSYKIIPYDRNIIRKWLNCEGKE